MRIEAAAPHRFIEDAAFKQAVKDFAPLRLRKLTQPGAGHLLFNAVHGVVEVVFGDLAGDLGKGGFQGRDVRQGVSIRQVRQKRRNVPFLHAPDIGKLVSISRMGIRYIEDVAQFCRLLVVVDQGDALCAAVDPAVEARIP